MGNSYIVFKAIAETLGFEYLVPPQPSERTLELGARLSPELLCLPFKINLGNFIEALEMGADTLAMVGGVGACRFGYYWKIQELLLKEAGYKFDMLHLNQLNVPDAYRELKLRSGKPIFFPYFARAFRVMWEKAKVLHKIENLKRGVMPFEEKKGDTAKVMKEALKVLEDAKTFKEIKNAEIKSAELLNSVPKDSSRNILKIGIVGEVFITLEPFANMGIEDKLSSLGICVDNPMSLFKWLKHIFHLDLFEKAGRRNLSKIAAPYLPHNPGGEAQSSVARTILYAKEGFDGVINIYPFSCMPGLISNAVLLKVRKDYNIPILNLSVDEHFSGAGFDTRLEAFVDLLKRRK
ncbi:MAG: CoA protein activase [Candidatus Saganbacteria bacterium]|nr:CoA protein activase [Candidatus Saganbacteria bacterium]